MAVTSRSLPQTTVPLTAGAVPGKPRLERWEPQLRFGLFILLAYLGVALIGGWGTIWINDVRYGRPRTVHVAGMVGHHETTGEPTHVVAMNLNRRVVVIELPGGDATKVQTMQGPYLFGANEDLTPVGVRLQDVNADRKADLVLVVKDEAIIYINTGERFRLITAGERKQLHQAP